MTVGEAQGESTTPCAVAVETDGRQGNVHNRARSRTREEPQPQPPRTAGGFVGTLRVRAAVLFKRPHSVEQLLRYAAEGDQVTQASGTWRVLGFAWCSIGIAITFVLYAIAWAAQLAPPATGFPFWLTRQPMSLFEIARWYWTGAGWPQPHIGRVALVLLPVSVGCYAAAWLVQRFLRFAAVVVFVGVTHWLIPWLTH